jgi:hypothetical protein
MLAAKAGPAIMTSVINAAQIEIIFTFFIYDPKREGYTIINKQ